MEHLSPDISEHLAGPKTPIRKSVGGLVILGVVSTAAVGLCALTFPFISPALRKICLPYVPATTMQVSNVMTALRGRTGKVVDLGSGDGRLVIEAAKNGFLAEGVELNYWLVWYSRFRAWQQGVSNQTKFTRGDLWKVQLSNYDNVIIFGIQEMMGDLETKAKRELQSSGCVIACRFPFPAWNSSAVIGTGIDTVWIYDRKL